jgi:hypothetical protein
VQGTGGSHGIIRYISICPALLSLSALFCPPFCALATTPREHTPPGTDTSPPRPCADPLRSAAAAAGTSDGAFHPAEVRATSAEAIEYFTKLSDTVLVLVFVLPLLSSIYYALTYYLEQQGCISPQADVEEGPPAPLSPEQMRERDKAEEQAIKARAVNS